MQRPLLMARENRNCLWLFLNSIDSSHSYYLFEECAISTIRFHISISLKWETEGCPRLHWWELLIVLHFQMISRWFVSPNLCTQFGESVGIFFRNMSELCMRNQHKLRIIKLAESHMPYSVIGTHIFFFFTKTDNVNSWSQAKSVIYSNKFLHFVVWLNVPALCFDDDGWFVDRK